MSDNHGGPVKQQSISEIAEYLKKMIPRVIPDNYELKPMFLNIAGEQDILNGVVAFRDFLYTLYDCLVSEGHKYFTLKKKPYNETDYPFIYQLTDLLSDIGYHSELNSDKSALVIDQLPSFIPLVDENGKKSKVRNSLTKLTDCMRLLYNCGFRFSGIDLDAGKIDPAEIKSLEVTYPRAPIMLTGLKVMSIADRELREKRYKNDNNRDNLLLCNYRLIGAEEPDATEILSDFLNPLPDSVQKFGMGLHKRYTDLEMVCIPIITTFDVHFAYSNIKSSKKIESPKKIYQKRIWEFSLSPRDGYSFVVRSKKTDKYPEVIKGFSLELQGKILKGYGCDRKLHNEPCRRGCQGIRLPLDKSILSLAGDIEVWLDNELMN